MKADIYYFSRTGNLEKFANKLREAGHENVFQFNEDTIVDKPFVVVASTIYFGEVPIEYKKFLKKNNQHLIGVSGSGNRNWGRNFAIAADIIAEKYNVPIISKFELSGNKHDLENFIKGVEEIENVN